MTDFTAEITSLEVTSLLVEADLVISPVSTELAVLADVGPRGPQGPQGEQGFGGGQGVAGPPGPQGDPGPEGPIGPSGGPVGPQGDVGPVGPQGPQGIQGPLGNPGPQGIQGIAGPQGDTGAAGQTVTIVGNFSVRTPAELPPSGLIPANWDSLGVPPVDTQMLNGQGMFYTPTGVVYLWAGTGITPSGWVNMGNVQGPEGPPGPQGSVGPQGPQGPVGLTGAAGPEGALGSVGPVGAKGDTGDVGPVGPKGDKGDLGSQGIQGVQGPQGDTGVAGPKGDTGTTGPTGGAGPTGSPGVPGVNAFSATTAGFTVPAVGATTTVDLADASWVTIGQMLWVETAADASNAGPLKVTGKTGNTVTLLNQSTSGGINEAPVDGTLYGRKDGTWVTAIGANSPVFTGDPQAPTPPPGDNDTSIATTAFVKSAVTAANQVFYCDLTDAANVATYKRLLLTPSAHAESSASVVCTGTTTDFLIASFITDPGVPGAIEYPAGSAYRRLYGSVSGGSAVFRLQVYSRTAGGVETLVRDEFSNTFSDTVATLQEWLATPSSGGSMSATDRIVIKVSARRVSGPTNVTVTLYSEGSAHASQIQTTITSGSSVSLSATPPLALVGGTLTIDLSGYQPLDADLTALAALTGTNVIYYRSAADTWSPVTVGANLTFSGGTLVAAVPAASSTNPVMNGTVAVGVGTTWARSDHVHASDTTRVPFGGGTMTGKLDLVGTATNDNAAASIVGEVISAAITTNQAITSAASMNVGSISLTAGDWDVDGQVQFIPSAAPTLISCAISTTSATVPVVGNTAVPVQRLGLSFTSAVTQILNTGRARLSLSATTTVYLCATATFTGTCNAQGYISARRRR